MTERSLPQDQYQTLEWLQANSGGSFAMGSADRVPRRKYHSHLTIRESDFGETVNILTEVGETVAARGKQYLLHNLDFGDNVFPQGYRHLVSFSTDPVPSWRYDLDGLRITRTLELDSAKDIVYISYSFDGVKDRVSVMLEPLFACRPVHQSAHENPLLNGAIHYGAEGSGVSFEPYAGISKVWMKISGASAAFSPGGRWDRCVYYSVEKERGYEPREDLFTPGAFRLDLERDGTITLQVGVVSLRGASLPAVERHQRASANSQLKRAASQFVVTRKSGLESIIAGYPWYGERGREALISLPGLCLSTGRAQQAQSILEGYGELLMKGEPLDHPAGVEQVQSSLVDVPLLYIRAVQALGKHLGKRAIKPLMPVVYHLLNSLKKSSDDRIQITSDCGLFVKASPYPMTWMNNVINGQALTPRHGFAVEVNALFYNAVRFALDWAQENRHADFIKMWAPLLEEAETAFLSRFWVKEFGYLADTFDGSAQDVSLRPNQLWALALPYSAVPAALGKQIIEKVRAHLLTPVGLRSLSSTDPRYQPRYGGGALERDIAAHQGSVWPWMIGLYADAVANLYGNERARAELRPMVVRLLDHLRDEGCIGQVSELFDGDEPHKAGGAPAQACSVAELLRVVALIGAENES